jgi:hypothetical protein
MTDLGDLGAKWVKEESQDQNMDDRIFAAVRAYARREFAALIPKVIYRLQRLPATGVYGDDYAFKTLWDEYCYEIQEGPFDLPGVLSPAGAWDHTIPAFLDDVIERIPHHQAILLSVFAAWELEVNDEKLIGSLWLDGIRQVLRSRLAEKAGERRLYRFVSS